MQTGLRIALFLMLPLTSAWGQNPHAPAVKPVPENEGKLLSGTRQLTFEGKRAGEGYFSADGRKLVFQSEREPGNPFYQIYLLDLETGDTERISPGYGKTTCAWVSPDGGRVMFASTQLDGESKEKQAAEFKARESGKARKYSWDYDVEFEVLEYDLAAKSYKNLTNSKGYDAEGAYSPDGKMIVFASNRQAYDGSMSEEDMKFFKLDKKFAMEIYTADADGGNVKRLTHADGYDGGPFFSADGGKICWRRFDRKGLTAEIYSMNVDGSDQQRLTNIGAMSWAPMFHPSGEYLIFTTNKHGFGNFELYLVRADGQGEPVRVTHTDGFDGLPAFSPDGRKLSWTSKRAASPGKKGSQIFLAGWNHEAARKMLGLDGAVTKAAAPAGGGAGMKTEAAITEADLKAHIGYLASKELQGRLTGTEGARLATQHVADGFAKNGLAADGTDGFFSPFEFTAGVAVGKDNALELDIAGEKIAAAVDRDWRPVSFSKLGKLDASGVVFAGYGLEVPAGDGADEYTSYYHLNVKGKWVMVMRYFPDDAPEEMRRKFQRYSRLRHKATIARRKFAAGIIFVTGPNTETKDELITMEFDASLADSGIPTISISTDMAERVLASAGKDLKAIQTELDTGEIGAGFTIPKVKITAVIDVDQEKRTGRNVLGRLKSDDPKASGRPAVIIGAHVDHLGAKAGPGSLAKAGERDLIHFGADDNASGVAGLLEVAEYLATEKKAGRLKLKRDLIFAAWSGEEIGLLGSSEYVRHIAKRSKGNENAPIGDQLAAYLNMDMIGRLGKSLVMQGLGSSDYWSGVIERRNAPIGLPITTQQDTYLPTDATVFYLRKVPILSAFTGSHEDYHTPRDTADKINYPGTKDVARLMALIARDLVMTDSPPKYLKVDPPKNRGARGFRVYLGTIPDYSQGDVKGVKLSGVSEKGPAAKAGVKGGDVIISLNGKDVLNIYDYTAVLGDMKVGKETGITVLRDGDEVELKITPGSRD